MKKPTRNFDENKLIRYSVLVLFLIPAILWIGLKSPLECAIFASLDDGFYYPKIAQNFLRCGKFTYDNITVTNGFHPLWQITILPLYLVFPGALAGLRAVYILLIIIGLLNTYLYLKICEKLKIGIAGLFIGMFFLFLNFRMFTLWFCLLETSMVLLALQILALSWIKWEGKRNAFIFGLLAGLVFLARTDNVFLLAILGLYISYRTGKQISIRKGVIEVLKYAAGIAVFAVPYLITNLVYFGKILPVSGARKIRLSGEMLSRFPRVIREFVWFWSSRVSYYLGVGNIVLYIIITGIAILAIGAFIILKRKRKLAVSGVITNKLLPFVIGAILHYLFVAHFMPTEAPYSFWYLIQEMAVITFIVVGLITDISNSFPKKIGRLIDVVSIVIVLFLLTAEIVYYPKYIEKRYSEPYDLAEYIKCNTDCDELFTCYDSGRLSYFSERNFIAANGLAGDYELAILASSDSRFENIIYRYGVDWVVLKIEEDKYREFGGSFEYASGVFQLYPGCDCRLVLLRTTDFHHSMIN